MLALLKLVPGKVWLFGALAAAFAFILWREHHAVHAAKQQRARAEQAEQTLIAERKAKKAEVAHVQENADTTQFRADNPLHGGLCQQPVQTRRTAQPVNAGTSTASADIQPVSAGDPEASGSGDADVRHLLDILAGRADQVSAELREWQTR